MSARAPSPTRTTRRRWLSETRVEHVHRRQMFRYRPEQDRHEVPRQGPAGPRLQYRQLSLRTDACDRRGRPGAGAGGRCRVRRFRGLALAADLQGAGPGLSRIEVRPHDAPTWLVSLTRHAERTGPTLSRQIAYGHALLWDDPADHIQVYERHAREVIEHFAGREDQLRVLCWERGDGWEELCGFLGRPAPAEPFPNTNTTDRQSEPDNGVGRRDRRDRR